ncbi:MAG: bifunctional precorrin-2 dehydrogenase/sirohydrochlorin ferrochelatase [Acidobacteriota bacterium]|nr:bifunctional precorrin-2 dehydrogenase/sirohydrochlorin ferrochelatase [Acidobacteriota bacterium]
MDLFPAFIKLAGRRVVVLGGGPVAASKLLALLNSGADITVVAPEIVPEIRNFSVTVLERGFQLSDLDGAWLVIAAATPDVNRTVAQAAETRHIFVNAVDDPPNATMYLGGVVRRAGVTFAISTDGRAPALAGLLREALDSMLPTRDLEQWMAEAAQLRQHWQKDAVPMQNRRPELLESLIRLYKTPENKAVTNELS